MSTFIEDARRLWDADDGYGCGEILFRRIPEHLHGKLILEMIDFVSKWIITSEAFTAIYPLIKGGDKISAKLLAYQHHHMPQSFDPNYDEILKSSYDLSEVMSKVAYNSTYPEDPFDFEWGYNLFACFRSLCNYSQDEDIKSMAWDLISHPDYYASESLSEESFLNDIKENNRFNHAEQVLSISYDEKECRELLDQALKLWSQDDFRFGRDAGLVFDQLVPQEKRPAWTTSLLQAFAKHITVASPEVGYLIQLAQFPEKWPLAKRSAYLLNRDYCEWANSNKPSDEIYLPRLLLGLAIETAKVVYNAANPDQIFEPNSMAFTLAQARGIQWNLKNDDLDAEIMRILTDEQVLCR